MLFLISLPLAALLLFLLKSLLKKHPLLCFWGALALSLPLSFLDILWVHHPFLHTVLGLFSKGALSGALWWTVAMTGALPRGKLRAFLLPLRGECSILAAALTLSHNIAYGSVYIKRIFTATVSPVEMAAGVLSLIMLLIMLPLTVLSFPAVRRRLKPSLWKNLQRTAYLFYALLFFHAALLFLPAARAGFAAARLNLLVYTFFFAGYALLRAGKALSPHLKKPLCISLFLLLFLLSMGTAVFAAFCCPLPPAPPLEEVIPPAAGQEETEEEEEALPPISYKDGVYEGTGMGYNGDVHVTVTVKNGRITEISAETEERDPRYFARVKDTLIAETIRKQSTHVDLVAGATASSAGFVDAMNAALAKALQEA